MVVREEGLRLLTDNGEVMLKEAQETETYVGASDETIRKFLREGLWHRPDEGTLLSPRLRLLCSDGHLQLAGKSADCFVRAVNSHLQAPHLRPISPGG